MMMMRAMAFFSFARAGSAGARLRACLYAVTLLAYMTIKLGGAAALGPAFSMLALLSIVVSIPFCGPVAAALSVLLLGTGSWMLWHAGASWPQYLAAQGDMAYLLAMFTVLPFLSDPIKLGGYDKTIQALMGTRVTSLFRLNCLVVVLAFVCGSFMSLASIPIMMAAMGPVVEGYPIDNKQRFMVVSAVSGYVLPMMWTPVSGVVGVVLYNLHMDWITMFPRLFALSIACLCGNWLVFYLLESRREGRTTATAPSAAAPAAGAPPARIGQVVVGTLMLITCIAAIEQGLHIATTTVVTLVAIPFAFAWCAVIGQGRRFVSGVVPQLGSRLPRMADQFAIFLSGGFFVRAMHLSGFEHLANLGLLHLHGLVGTHLLLILLPVLTLALSVLGVHPLVAIVLFGESLKPEVFGITPEKMSLTLIGSCVLTFMQGPFSGTLGLVHSITNLSTFRLARWTAPYAFMYFVLLSIAILLT
jgi:hypothetical protein